MKKVNSESEYNRVMAKIDSLILHGGEHISKDHLAEIRKLALAAQEYEQHKYVMDTPAMLKE